MLLYQYLKAHLWFCPRSNYQIVKMIGPVSIHLQYVMGICVTFEILYIVVSHVHGMSDLVIVAFANYFLNRVW